MPFGCKPKSWGRRAPWTAFAGLALLFGVAATALSEPPKPPKDRQGRTLTPATVPNQIQLQRNRAILILTSNGQIGATRGSVAGGGFWIATTNQYIFSSGPNIGATIPSTGDTVVAIGGPFSQFPESAGTVGIPGLDVYWTSADPADAASFPEVCTVDDFRVAQFPYSANGRAMTKIGEDGFVRVVARSDNHLVLGIQAVGQGVSELSAAFGLAVEMGARLEDIAGTIHAHPTQGEAFQEAAIKALYGQALHI